MTAKTPAILGESEGLLLLDGVETHQQVVYPMTAQAGRSLDLISRHLDPRIYDTDEFIQAIRELAIRSQYVSVRILLLDAKAVVNRGHRLLNLAQRLSSRIQIMVPGREHRDFNEAMLVADRSGYLHCPVADRYTGEANLSDRRTAEALARRFDELWERADSHPDLRALLV